MVQVSDGFDEGFVVLESQQAVFALAHSFHAEEEMVEVVLSFGDVDRDHVLSDVKLEVWEVLLVKLVVKVGQLRVLVIPDLKHVLLEVVAGCKLSDLLVTIDIVCDEVIVVDVINSWVLVVIESHECIDFFR